MAALIASPLCCCLAYGEMMAVAVEEEAASTCCQTAEMEVPMQNETVPCECEGAEEVERVVVKTVEVEKTSWDLVNEVKWVVEDELLLPGVERDLPAGSGACVNSARDLLAVHCVLLL